MKPYIKAVKETDKSLFTDPVLRPFKDLEVVLRGVGNNYNALTFAVINNAVWTPYKKAVDKIRDLIKEILTLDVKDPEICKSLDSIAPILDAVFDSRIIETILIYETVKDQIKKSKDNFKENVTVFMRQGPAGPGGYVRNYVLDFIIEDEVFSMAISVTPLNSFRGLFNSRAVADAYINIEQLKTQARFLLAHKKKTLEENKTNG